MIICLRMEKTYTAKTLPDDFKVTTLENPLLSKQAIISKGILVSYTNLQLNPYPNIQLCQVLNVQNNWQIVNTNLSRYKSQSLQVLLDNAQGDSSQDSRTYKLQEEDFIICLVRSIERQARSIESRICRILIKPKQQFKPIQDQGF